MLISLFSHSPCPWGSKTFFGEGWRKETGHFSPSLVRTLLLLGGGPWTQSAGVERRPRLLEMPQEGQDSSPRRGIQVPPVKEIRVDNTPGEGVGRRRGTQRGENGYDVRKKTL